MIEEFIDRCFADTMIGFLFQRADPARIKRFEFEHAAEFLGAPVRYRGRSLAAAHARHRIMGGQFDRRLTILREVLESRQVPDEIRDAWLAHHERLRSEVTLDERGECIPRK